MTITKHAPDLIALCKSIFCAAGAPDDIGALVAESLVESNLRGHDSHGVIQTFRYVDKIRRGDLKPQARPRLERQIGAVATVDCHNGFGQVAARFGADLAGRIAREHGVGCVALARVNHIGRLGEYAERLAADDLIGIVMTSGASAGGSVAPFRGQERVFGTNPMAWAVPVPETHAPLVVDFATAMVALGKVALAKEYGVPIPPGWLLDRDGQPTTDPAAFDAGGMLLPFGAYKGYGLMLMMEIIPTILAGYAPVSSPDYRQGNPTLVIALSIEAFTAREVFSRYVDELLRRVKACAPLDDSQPVMLPGEPEMFSRQHRLEYGIPLPETMWQKLLQLRAELNT